MPPRFLQRSQAVLWQRYRKHRSERAQRSNADEHYGFEAIGDCYLYVG